MKNLKRIASLLLALVMVFSLAITASAESGVDTPAATGTITITPPDGVDDEATNTYKIYKVFDAVAGDGTISYKLVSGKTEAPAGFSVDTAGNVSYAGDKDATELTAADIAAIAAYVTEADLVDTVTTTGSAAAVSKALPNGYYYITTSTGTVVTINSTNPNAEVNDKNTAPIVDKKITGASSVDTDGKTALAEVGSTVTYTATITVGKGEKNYVFHDKMSDGLSYNGEVAVTGIDENQYTVNETPDEGDTITITFVDGLAENTVITITYSATVTSDALTDDPANNTAYVSYGDESSNNKTPDSTTDVYNAKFTVTKQDGSGNPLEGAGFVIAKTEGEGDNAVTKYYKIADNDVDWVDTIDEATEYTSDAKGAVQAFTGLANGTYTLVEKTVPAGYNKAADQDFTIAEHNYTAANLEQAATVTNNAGSVLPSTGGIGTTLFYVFGGILVAAAVVLLVTKKRMSAAE